MTAPAAAGGLTPDFRALFESVPGLYLVVLPNDPVFTIVAMSDGYALATMTKREEILGRGLFEVFPDNPADPAANGVQNLHTSLLRVLERRLPDAMPFQKYDIRRPEWEGGGFEERYWSPLNSPVIGEGGRIQYVIHRVEDVTEFVRLQESEVQRKRDEEALQESEQELRNLANSIPQLVWMAEPDGFIFWYNQRWYEFTGTTPEQMAGWGWQRVHDPEILPQVLERWTTSLLTGTPLDMEFPLRGADGVFRWFLTRVTPSRNVEGHIVRWFGTNTDIDELRRIREERFAAFRREQIANEELRRANSDLEQFAYSASHDLKEPLRNVAIYSEMIERRYGNGLDANAREILAGIAQNARRMDALVNGLLAFTRAGSPGGDEETEKASASEALAAALEDLSSTVT
ncbi:MAG: PAS domain-containing protein, partial [Acidobacteriia bacterium]|nr:PAS domain-containing protein [Terriglobia bacterium]